MLLYSTVLFGLKIRALVVSLCVWSSFPISYRFVTSTGFCIVCISFFSVSGHSFIFEPSGVLSWPSIVFSSSPFAYISCWSRFFENLMCAIVFVFVILHQFINLSKNNH